MPSIAVDIKLRTYDVMSHPYLRDLAESRSTLDNGRPVQVTFTICNPLREELIEVTGSVLELSYSGDSAIVKLLDQKREIWKLSFPYRTV